MCVCERHAIRIQNLVSQSRKIRRWEKGEQKKKGVKDTCFLFLVCLIHQVDVPPEPGVRKNIPPSANSAGDQVVCGIRNPKEGFRLEEGGEEERKFVCHAMTYSWISPGGLPDQEAS